MSRVSIFFGNGPYFLPFLSFDAVQRNREIFVPDSSVCFVEWDERCFFGVNVNLLVNFNSSVERYPGENDAFVAVAEVRVRFLCIQYDFVLAFIFYVFYDIYHTRGDCELLFFRFRMTFIALGKIMQRWRLFLCTRWRVYVFWNRVCFCCEYERAFWEKHSFSVMLLQTMVNPVT